MTKRLEIDDALGLLLNNKYKPTKHIIQNPSKYIFIK
jgi:hypothetical protein